jgi:L-amino acid N-acyltransferase YncA
MATTAIRQLALNDFEDMYQIWEEGIAAAFSNPTLTSQKKQAFYRQFFYSRLQQQDNNFKIWGYFEDDILVGWQSMLPCQASPIVWDKFAESSTYVRRGKRTKGVGRALLIHAIYEARHHSELAYIMGFVSSGNPHMEKLVQEVGFQKIGPLYKSLKDDTIGDVMEEKETISTVWVVIL